MDSTYRSLKILKRQILLIVLKNKEGTKNCRDVLSKINKERSNIIANSID